MSRHIFVRPARPEDAATVVEWSRATPNNLWDAAATLYPSTFVLCAYNSDGPLVYVPIQRPLMLEALAIRPNASAIDTAAALKELTQAVVTAAYGVGAGEVYFVCRDESTIEFAKRHVFEELPYRLFRLKLSDLEKP